MKKKRVGLLYPREKVRKLIIMTKICLLFVVFSLQLNAMSYSQQKKISLKLESVSLEKVFIEIEKKSELAFSYKQSDVIQFKNIAVNFKNTKIQKILDHCLRGTDLTYFMISNHIVIKKLKQSQDKKQTPLKGKVTDNKGNPLPGVSVIIKGTNVGVSTDSNGKFQINAKKGDVLIFSFMGMKTSTITIKDNKPITVKLLEDTKLLDEVVATGYANVSKKSFTGNAVTVKKEDLLKVSTTSIISALQAFDPSFRIEENNEMGSDPNHVPEMYIRGRSGIGTKELDNVNFSQAALKSNPNLPTFILDGFEVSIEKIFDFDINRIEDITILKDAAATAMYGSRAANGVVIINTIKPKAGKLHVTYNLTGSVEVPDLSDYDMMNAQEKFETEILAGYYSPEGYQSPKWGDILFAYYKKYNQLSTGVETDWMAQPLQNAYNFKHSLFIEGGSEDLRFGVDLNYNKSNGVMKESHRDRVGASLYLDYKYKNLQIKNQFSYNTTDSKNSKYGSFGAYTKELPYNMLKDKYGKYTESSKMWFSGTATENPMYRASLNNHSISDYYEFRDNLSLIWYVNDYFHIKGSLTASVKNSSSDNFVDPRCYTEKNAYRDDFSLRGNLSLSNTESKSYSGRLFGYYNRTVGVHNINFYLGVEVNNNKYSTLSQSYRGFPSGFLNSQNYAKEVVDKPTKFESTKRSIGGILGLNYTINNIYLFDVSLRMDGSSEFGENKRYAPFWATGFGLNLHKYKFMENVSFVDMLRVRSSYGQTGKVNFPAYCAINMYEVVTNNVYKNGYGAELMALGNKDLVWEKTNTLDFGFEATLLKRLTLKASYYNARTKDLITDVTVPSSAGFISYKDNMGEIENKGYELNINLMLLKTKDWFVSVYGNGSHNKNKIIKISDALKAYNDKVDEFFAGRNPVWYDEKYIKPLRKYVEGGSTTSIFGMKSLGIDPMSGKEVFVRRDGTITNEWESVEQQILGNTEPDLRGSLGLNLQYKNFTLFASCLYQFGAQRYNSTLVTKVESVDIQHSNCDRRVLTDRWKEVGDFSKFKGIKEHGPNLPTSRFVQNYDVVELTSLTVNYDFNKSFAKKLGLKLLRIGMTANDLGRLCTVKAERGLSYPYSRRFNFSIKAKF